MAKQNTITYYHYTYKGKRYRGRYLGFATELFENQEEIIGHEVDSLRVASQITSNPREDEDD